jgi:hypothetical protein
MQVSKGMVQMADRDKDGKLGLDEFREYFKPPAKVRLPSTAYPAILLFPSKDVLRSIRFANAGDSRAGEAASIATCWCPACMFACRRRCSS